MIKILLVDDEIDFVDTLANRLARRDLPAETAFDGEEALRLVTNEIPDVVVLDLKMPGLPGQYVLRHLKQVNPNIQVIILTGHGSEQARMDVMLLGAYAYLEKPVNIDTLIDTIRKAHQEGTKKRGGS